MIGVSITSEDRASDVLRGMSGRVRNFFGDSKRAAVDSIRDSVGEEIRGAHWKRPSGGRTPWPKSKPFGNRVPGPPLGGSGGRIGRAWSGGKGGFSRHRKGRVVVGVRVAGAKMFRGGATGVSLRPTTIRAKKRGAKGKPKMFWFLGMRYGVWISPAKLLGVGLKVDPRPHATDNPDLRDDLGGILLQEWIG